MGNIVSVHGDKLATAAVANSMKLNKQQMVHIRNGVESMMDGNGQIRRRFFHIAVAKARVAIDPDGDILDALFTMWDLTGKDSVPAIDFCVGFSVLACYGDSLVQVLKFALEIQDVEETELITAEELVNILKSKEEKSMRVRVCRVILSLTVTLHATRYCNDSVVFRRHSSRSAENL